MKSCNTSKKNLSMTISQLPSRIDFRSVYATLIRHWLGRDPQPILGRAWPTLGFLGS